MYQQVKKILDFVYTCTTCLYIKFTATGDTCIEDWRNKPLYHRWGLRCIKQICTEYTVPAVDRF